MNKQVFINCPFSKDYSQFMRAIIFAVKYCGFEPRSALETDDNSKNRFDKICELIELCQLSIHDISKTGLSGKKRLPRFNMPFELGLFLGAKKFGNSEQHKKTCLVFDKDQHRFKEFLSDFSGNDIRAHRGSLPSLVKELVNWLEYETGESLLPGGDYVLREFEKFSKTLPKICRALKKKPSELTFKSYRVIAAGWIATNTKAA
jgi:hypothetical protein